MGGRREIADGMVQARRQFQQNMLCEPPEGDAATLQREETQLQIKSDDRRRDRRVSVELPLSRRFRQTNLEHFEAEQNIAVGGRRKQLFGRSEATILGNLQSYLEMILMETL